MKRRRIDWDAQPLGEKMDREIAAKLGVSVQAVFSQRRQRGIASKIMHDRRPELDIDWRRIRLGVLTDAEIARSLGCSQNTVRMARFRLGIDKAHGPGRPRSNKR